MKKPPSTTPKKGVPENFEAYFSARIIMASLEDYTPYHQQQANGISNEEKGTDGHKHIRPLLIKPSIPRALVEETVPPRAKNTARSI